MLMTYTRDEDAAALRHGVVEPGECRCHLAVHGLKRRAVEKEVGLYELDARAQALVAYASKARLVAVLHK